MEEKKSNGLVVVVALLCLLVGGVGGYFISTNYFNKNEANNQSNTANKNITTNENQTTIEDNTQSQCKYEKLKDPKYLSNSEKDELVKIATNNIKDLDADYSSVEFFWKSDYLYEIRFNYDKCVGKDDCDIMIDVLFWKENNAWKYKSYKPFDYAPEDQVANEKADEIENVCK